MTTIKIKKVKRLLPRINYPYFMEHLNKWEELVETGETTIPEKEVDALGDRVEVIEEVEKKKKTSKKEEKPVEKPVEEEKVEEEK